MKIPYLLNEVEVLKTITNVKKQRKEGYKVQHRGDAEAYQGWLKKNYCVRFTLLNSMQNDIIEKLEYYPTVQSMWDRQKIIYVDTSASRLCAMMFRFEIYIIDPKQIMADMALSSWQP